MAPPEGAEDGVEVVGPYALHRDGLDEVASDALDGAVGDGVDSLSVRLRPCSSQPPLGEAARDLTSLDHEMVVRAEGALAPGVGCDVEALGAAEGEPVALFDAPHDEAERTDRLRHLALEILAVAEGEREGDEVGISKAGEDGEVALQARRERPPPARRAPPALARPNGEGAPLLDDDVAAPLREAVLAVQGRARHAEEAIEEGPAAPLVVGPPLEAARPGRGRFPSCRLQIEAAPGPPGWAAGRGAGPLSALAARGRLRQNAQGGVGGGGPAARGAAGARADAGGARLGDGRGHRRRGTSRTARS